MQVDLRLPRQCPKCEARGVVLPLTTVVGTRVHIAWECRRCRHEWPATTSDYERRGGIQQQPDDPPPDRRRTP